VAEAAGTTLPLVVVLLRVKATLVAAAPVHKVLVVEAAARVEPVVVAALAPAP
jgi:hypothetical protein